MTGLDGVGSRSGRSTASCSRNSDLPTKLIISVGDITPVEGVPAHVKHELEQEAMDAFLNEMLGGDGNKDARDRFRSLWDVRVPPADYMKSSRAHSRQEYEARETPESKLVKVSAACRLVMNGCLPCRTLIG